MKDNKKYKILDYTNSNCNDIIIKSNNLLIEMKDYNILVLSYAFWQIIGS